MRVRLRWLRWTRVKLLGCLRARKGIAQGDKGAIVELLDSTTDVEGFRWLVLGETLLELSVLGLQLLVAGLEIHISGIAEFQLSLQTVDQVLLFVGRHNDCLRFIISW